MRKALIVVLALALMVTALGVLTVGEKTQDKVAVVEVTYEDGTVEKVKVSVLPEAFEDEGGWKTVLDSDKVIVKVDPIHVGE